MPLADARITIVIKEIPPCHLKQYCVVIGIGQKRRSERELAIYR